MRNPEAMVAEVVARLKSGKLDVCRDCGGQGYTDSGKSACFWCRGAGVITQPMAFAFGVADRCERAGLDPALARPAGDQT